MYSVMTMIRQRYSFNYKTMCLLGLLIVVPAILSSLVLTSYTNTKSTDPLTTLTSDTILSEDYHSSHSIVVPSLSHEYIYWDLDYSDGIYGDFEVTDNTITFFICDQENYDLWDSGETASAYHLQEVVTSYSFHFRIPYDDTWYFVFKNNEILISKTVNFDLYRDLTPPSIDMNADTGATYSGIKEITASISEEQFDIGSVRLYIDGSLVDTEYDESFSYSWNTASYSNGAHTIRITATDNVGNSGYEEVTVYTSNPVTTSTSSTDGGDDGGGIPDIPPSFLLLATIGIVALIVVVGIVTRSRGGQ